MYNWKNPNFKDKALVSAIRPLILNHVDQSEHVLNDI